jgi:hypothetical protein
MEFAIILKQLMQQKGLKQADLCRITNIQSSIYILSMKKKYFQFFTLWLLRKQFKNAKINLIRLFQSAHSLRYYFILKVATFRIKPLATKGLLATWWLF